MLCSAGAFAGVFVTFFLAKDKSAYCQSIRDGCGDKGATIPFACFIFAALFAAILRESGLVGAIIWAAYKLGVQEMYLSSYHFSRCVCLLHLPEQVLERS